ncbi:MAG TPA: hypothetical protein VFF89_05195, partial [Sphingobium sp.]|nr:hypothetical protein [Sphingobium sp.]
ETAAVTTTRRSETAAEIGIAFKTFFAEAVPLIPTAPTAPSVKTHALLVTFARPSTILTYAGRNAQGLGRSVQIGQDSL